MLPAYKTSIRAVSIPKLKTYFKYNKKYFEIDLLLNIHTYTYNM